MPPDPTLLCRCFIHNPSLSIHSLSCSVIYAPFIMTSLQSRLKKLKLVTRWACCYNSYPPICYQIYSLANQVLKFYGGDAFVNTFNAVTTSFWCTLKIATRYNLKKLKSLNFSGTMPQESSFHNNPNHFRLLEVFIYWYIHTLIETLFEKSCIRPWKATCRQFS